MSLHGCAIYSSHVMACDTLKVDIQLAVLKIDKLISIH